MKYSYIDIKTFFEKEGYAMQTPRDGFNYINSEVKNKLGFALKSSETEVSFCWQVRNGEFLLDNKLPEICKQYPKAHTKHGKKNDDWTRLFIPLDQKKPLTDTLDVLEKTKGIVGYGERNNSIQDLTKKKLNMFNLDIYEKENVKIIEEIKKILPDWQKTQGFVADGLFDPKKYSGQKLKILFVLAEYYDHDKEGMIDIKLQLKEGDKFYDFLGLKNKKYPNTKTVKTISGLLYYLYNHYDEKSEKISGYVKQDKELFKTRSKEKYFIQAQENYSKCGMIDIKKNSAADDIRFTREKAKEAIKKYSRIINKQIEIISPNLIIVCGNDIIDALQKIQNISFDLKEYPKKNKLPIVKEINGINYAFVCHPTRWWNHKWLYEIYKEIIRKIVHIE